MAYTRIHGIKTTLNKALDYIENPEKTEEQLLVSGYNVDPLSASIEYRMTAALAREIKGDYTKSGGADNLAYHMIQSFAPYDKITAEQAHELGKKWADEILQGKYEYVISTHVDKGHIHNHIIFNATSFYDYSKYDNYKVAAHLREVSDRLCAEQGLYVIEKPNLKKKSPTHYEWEQRKAGTSWKAQIQSIIDKAISETNDYESFKAALEKANVEVKEGKRISFKITGTGQERFCRGDRIGEDYSRERIIERLAEPKKKNREKVMPPKEAEQGAAAAPAGTTPRERQPVFSSYDKKIEWQAQRTKLAATKELAAALLTIRQENIQQESDFDIRVNSLLEKSSGVRSTMAELSGKNQQYKDAAKYLLAFREYLPIKQEAERQSPFTKKRFLSRYESELSAFDHAAAQLEKLGVNTNVDPDKVITLVKDQDGKISGLAAALQEVTDRISSIRKAHELVDGMKQEPKREQDKGRDKEQEI
ncbi:MAG: relaxase/mobilization nuclease domain-containing protein [Parabacteroides sp.]|nr:relaxase/mobilization nuclease domain-containing protein [Parabacteroides sp.]